MTTPQVACICLVCGMLAVTSGCALPMRAWYDGLQIGAQNSCDNQPPGAREECQARLNNKSYDAYEKERSAPR
jgi:hypothetical protein